MTKLRVLALSAVSTAMLLAVVHLFGRDPDAASDLSQQAEAAAVLRGWDRARSHAWSQGDPRSLRRLYAEHSGAGRVDVRNLKRWAAAGLQVDGLRTEVLALEVLAQEPGRWVLRVTDRSAGGIAVGADTAIPLPSDRATTRTIVLVEAGAQSGSEAGWLIESVT